MRTLGAVFVVALAAVPVAQAQTDPDGEWSVPEGPHAIAAETESLTLALTFHYHCQAAATFPRPIEATFTVNQTPIYAGGVFWPQNRSVTWSAIEEDCVAPDSYIDLATNLTTFVTRQAPAFEPFVLTFDAVVTYGPPQAPTLDGPYTAQVTMESTYFALIEAIPRTTLVKTPPGSDVELPVDVTNYANAPTRVNASWRPTTATAMPVDMPPPVVLESRMTHGQQADVEETMVVGAHAPPAGGLYENRIYSFAVDFTGTDERGTTDATNTQTVFFTVQVQGSNVESPGLPALLVAALVVVTSALIRRRQ